MVRDPRIDGGAQLDDHGFQILRVDGRDPFLAGQCLIAVGQTDEIEEQGGAADAAGDEIQIKDAEAAGGLRKFEKFGGSAHATSSKWGLQAQVIGGIRPLLI